MRRRLDRRLLPRVLAGARQAWLDRLHLPNRYGGREGTYLERLIITEELLRAGAPVAAHWFGDRQIGPALLAHGTEAQRQELLPRIVRGELVFCVGMSEPNAGSDLASLRTRAVADGDYFVIDGHKIWTTGAHEADYRYLVARTDPRAAKHSGIERLLSNVRVLEDIRAHARQTGLAREPVWRERLADRFATLRWPVVLDGFARRVNPLLCHATLCLRAEEVLTFLGRKPQRGFAGEILNDCKRRWPGARVKHWMKANWIKMYDKHGCILRVETVINDPYEFKVRRRTGRPGRRTLGWQPLPKGVAYLPRLRRRVGGGQPPLSRCPRGGRRPGTRAPRPRSPRPAGARSLRALLPRLQPGGAADLALFTAVLRGEHTLQGFRNREVRMRLFGSTAAADHRRSAQVSRLVKRLHLRGFVAKIPRSRRWRITQLGHAVMSAAVQLREDHFPNAFIKQAA